MAINLIKTKSIDKQYESDAASASLNQNNVENNDWTDVFNLQGINNLSNWMRFIGLCIAIYFIILTLLLFGCLFLEKIKGYKTAMLVALLVIIGCFLLNLCVIRSAKALKRFAIEKSPKSLNDGLMQLRLFCKINGMLLIACFGIYVLLIVVGLMLY